MRFFFLFLTRSNIEVYGMHTTMFLFLEIVGLTFDWMHLCFFDEMKLIAFIISRLLI